MTVEGVGVCLRDGGARRWILRDIGFAAEAGEVVAVCGPSGSGKSTLLNLVGGLRIPDEGSIRLDIEADGKRISLRVHELSEVERVRFGHQRLDLPAVESPRPQTAVAETVQRLRRLCQGVATRATRAVRSLTVAVLQTQQVEVQLAHANLLSPHLVRTCSRNSLRRIGGNLLGVASERQARRHSGSTTMFLAKR